VEIKQDTGFRGQSPTQRQFVVKVSAMGTQRGQRIQVVKSDDSGRGVVVGDPVLDPGASREIKVTVDGNATIEVYHNDKAVFSEPYPLETTPQ